MSVDQSGWSEPTESEIFAASTGFNGAPDLFAGADAFTVGDPVPAMWSPWPRPTGTSISCLEVAHSLPVFLDGELTSAQHVAVEAHIALCPPCQRASAFQAQLRTTVATKAIDHMPDDARARITRALGLD